MDKVKNAIDFYLLTNSLKYRLRQGWIYWGVSKERLESIAEHVYGTCMLAISIDSEFNLNIDINKVIKMLSIHELEEIVIGDQTPFDEMSAEEKLEKGHKAVKKILGDLVKKDELMDLIIEFDKRESNEAHFAYLIDKLEADIQAKIYEDMGCNKLDKDYDSPVLKNKNIQDIINNGATTVFDVWYEFDKNKYSHDQTFIELLD